MSQLAFDPDLDFPPDNTVVEADGYTFRFDYSHGFPGWVVTDGPDRIGAVARPFSEAGLYVARLYAMTLIPGGTS